MAGTSVDGGASFLHPAEAGPARATHIDERDLAAPRVPLHSSTAAHESISVGDVGVGTAVSN